jgi:hypothetical protein
VQRAREAARVFQSLGAAGGGGTRG